MAPSLVHIYSTRHARHGIASTMIMAARWCPVPGLDDTCTPGWSLSRLQVVACRSPCWRSVYFSCLRRDDIPTNGRPRLVQPHSISRQEDVYNLPQFNGLILPYFLYRRSLFSLAIRGLMYRNWVAGLQDSNTFRHGKSNIIHIFIQYRSKIKCCSKTTLKLESSKCYYWMR